MCLCRLADLRVRYNVPVNMYKCVSVYVCVGGERKRVDENNSEAKREKKEPQVALTGVQSCVSCSHARKEGEENVCVCVGRRDRGRGDEGGPSDQRRSEGCTGCGTPCGSSRPFLTTRITRTGITSVKAHTQTCYRKEPLVSCHDVCYRKLSY